MAAISVYTAVNAVAQVEPFLYRAPLDPFKIQQLPDFLMASRQRSDFVVQRAVFTPGVGGWHTHPGPSFAYVLQGHIQLQKFSEKDGCFEGPVYGPGDIYIKPANELHRAIVLGDEDEAELIVRFNIPQNGPIGIPAEDPGCSVPLGAPLSEAMPLALAHGPDTLDNFIVQQVAPFTARATLDPYQIHQLPDFLMHSNVRSDIVIQRSVFAPGPGIWHIHLGPSFVYVIDGQIRLQRFDKKQGHSETPVFGPGEVYFEEANQVHRAVVLSEQSAVLMVARFNIPVGAPITVPVPAPGN